MINKSSEYLAIQYINKPFFLFLVWTAETRASASNICDIPWLCTECTVKGDITQYAPYLMHIEQTLRVLYTL
jgi:hypothetical protein